MTTSMSSTQIVNSSTDALNPVNNSSNDAANRSIQFRNQSYDDFNLPNQGFSLQNHGFNLPNQGFSLQNHGFNLPNQGLNIQTHGFNTQNQGLRSFNQGFLAQNPGFSLLNRGFSSLNQDSQRQEALSSQHHHHHHHHEHHHVIAIKSLLPATTCSEFRTRGKKGTLLPVFHKDGPCSPLSTVENGPKPQNYTHALIKDQSRVQSIHSRISKGGVSIEPEEARLPAESAADFGSGNYYVKVGFGTRKRDLPLIFDTGSDLTWIQCQPCLGGCYEQSDPIYDPKKSSSYSNIPCNSTECTQLKSATGHLPSCMNSSCGYSITYGDGSYSRGISAHENLTITPSDTFPNFRFGCGQSNGGLFRGTAGLLGLGRDNISFVSQTSNKYKKVFSYCISPSSYGFLAFGDSSSVKQFTPLLTDKRDPSFYFLNLTGISVGALKLALSPSTFSLSGTIIDSGTVITRLPSSAYAALRSAFKHAMKSYPRAPKFDFLDTCYNFTGLKNVTLPKIVFHFQGGADLDVHKSGILVETTGESQTCLAFIANKDARGVTIIGNLQQQTVEVVYDVAGGKLGFGPGGCN
ncbi:hypothetical protein IFM89_019681 [Coptis chinensis]|uniref:Peptidase A1 domain-containing protein n=1 Tax=Coptis chinensis TaxID=261450 RepID=A0A835HQS4_9MAGN|nr:hypothetical protein IFM89_019681 [Coptis chinensis]